MVCYCNGVMEFIPYHLKVRCCIAMDRVYVLDNLKKQSRTNVMLKLSWCVKRLRQKYIVLINNITGSVGDVKQIQQITSKIKKRSHCTCKGKTFFHPSSRLLPSASPAVFPQTSEKNKWTNIFLDEDVTFVIIIIELYPITNGLGLDIGSLTEMLRNHWEGFHSGASVKAYAIDKHTCLLMMAKQA